MGKNLNLDELEVAPYRPSQKERDYIAKLNKRLQSAITARKRPYNILNQRSPEEYWRESEQRWISYIPDKRKKDWQSKVVKPVTRNKCIGIIANLLASQIEPEFFSELNGRNVGEVADAIRDLYELSQEKDRHILKQLMALVDAVSCGTAYVQEDYVKRLRKVKEIKNWNPDTGEIEYEFKNMMDFEGMMSNIVSPYEVYLGNVYEFDMKKQPYRFRRRVVPYSEAESEFGRYSNFKFVEPGNIKRKDAANSDETFFAAPNIGEDLDGDDVEIVYYLSSA